MNDLGIYTNIAARAAPDGIDKGDWQTISDAILGGVSFDATIFTGLEAKLIIIIAKRQ